MGGRSRSTAGGASTTDGPASGADSRPEGPGNGAGWWFGFAVAFVNAVTAGTAFGGGTGFFASTDAGPNPVRTTASAEAGGFGPSNSTGTPASLAARKPFSTVSIEGSSRRTSVSAASMAVTVAVK